MEVKYVTIRIGKNREFQLSRHFFDRSLLNAVNYQFRAAEVSCLRRLTAPAYGSSFYISERRFIARETRAAICARTFCGR